MILTDDFVKPLVIAVQKTAIAAFARIHERASSKDLINLLHPLVPHARQNSKRFFEIFGFFVNFFEKAA